MPGHLQIGPLRLSSPAVQAALSGYSDLPMRRVARAHGAPYALNEVVLDALVLVRGKQRRRLLELSPDDHPVGGQLMGSVPETFGAAAQELVRAGYDVVDLNFGCPVSKVLGRCRGGYLLQQPEQALEIVQRVLDAVAGAVPVTVKLRRGFDDSPAAERAFWEILEGAFARGIDAATVHGRTVRQKYVGPSQWQFLRRVRNRLPDRVILGSGDLFGPFDAVRMLRETGVDGVTMARGCIGNPFVFDQVAALLAGGVPMTPTVGAQRRALEQHWRAAREHYDLTRAVATTRRHAIKYAQYHPEPIAAREALVAVHSIAELEVALDAVFDAARWPGASRALRPEDAVVPACAS